MSEDNPGYTMSEAGAVIMARVLENAGKMVNLKQITKNNLADFIKTFADTDLLWEETGLTDLNERKVMMFFALEPIVLHNDYVLPTKNEYN